MNTQNTTLAFLQTPSLQDYKKKTLTQRKQCTPFEKTDENEESNNFNGYRYFINPSSTLKPLSEEFVISNGAQKTLFDKNARSISIFYKNGKVTDTAQNPKIIESMRTNARNFFVAPGEKGTNSTTDFDIFFKKFTNLLMIHGKKVKASLILFNMCKILKKKIQKNIININKIDFDQKTTPKTLQQPVLCTNLTDKGFEKNSTSFFDKNGREIPLNLTVLYVISKAVENIIPNLEVRKVRVAGSTYIVPAVLTKKKQETLALKWIIESAKKRQKNSKLEFSTCLADEIFDAYQKLGQARQKRDELHRLAQMNRAYIRYRWW